MRPAGPTDSGAWAPVIRRVVGTGNDQGAALVLPCAGSRLVTLGGLIGASKGLRSLDGPVRSDDRPRMAIPPPV